MSELGPDLFAETFGPLPLRGAKPLIETAARSRSRTEAQSCLQRQARQAKARAARLALG